MFNQLIEQFKRKVLSTINKREHSVTMLLRYCSAIRNWVTMSH